MPRRRYGSSRSRSHQYAPKRRSPVLPVALCCVAVVLLAAGVYIAWSVHGTKAAGASQSAPVTVPASTVPLAATLPPVTPTPSLSLLLPSAAALTPSSKPVDTQKANTPKSLQSPTLPADPGGNPQNQPVTQAIVVLAGEGSAHASVQYYDCSNGSWTLKEKVAGYVGRNGITGDKHEGDGKTPKGIFYLGFAFGTEKPATGLDFRLITKNSYWVHDTDSEYYNTWQEGKKGWNSAEKLSSAPTAYHYAIAVRYNVDCVPGKGSAIFLHCSMGKGTSGCVSVPEASVKRFLGWLDKGRHPVIIIANTAEEAGQYGIVPEQVLQASN